MKVFAAALAVALSLAACGSAGPSATLLTTVSPSISPTDGPSPATPSGPVETSPPPTTLPQPTLYGEFPGPDATVPPGQPVIADLSFDELAGLWASLGLSCRSHASGGPESPAAFNVHCEGGDPTADMEVVAEADYWTLDGVATMHMDVGPISDGSVDPGVAAERWVLPFAELAGGSAAVAWVNDHIGDSSCRLGCTTDVRGSDLSYYSGSRGGQELFFVAPVK